MHLPLVGGRELVLPRYTQPEPEAPVPEAGLGEKMRHRLQTSAECFSCMSSAPLSRR